MAITTFLILLFNLSETKAKAISAVMTTNTGSLNPAEVPIPSEEPLVPLALPANKDELTYPPERVNFLILWPDCSVTIAKLPSAEISNPLGFWNLISLSTPSAYAAVQFPQIVVVLPSDRFIFRMA